MKRARLEILLIYYKIFWERQTIESKQNKNNLWLPGSEERRVIKGKGTMVMWQIDGMTLILPLEHGHMTLNSQTHKTRLDFTDYKCYLHF